KDPYPVDALPTCNHALSVCQQERKCIKLFEDFKLHCKVRENKCRMEDRDLCYEAWTNLRLSPMFGCICPNNHMKRRCDKIFSVVNHNPCVGVDTSTIRSVRQVPSYHPQTCKRLDGIRSVPSWGSVSDKPKSLFNPLATRYCAWCVSLPYNDQPKPPACGFTLVTKRHLYLSW
uniref:GDNF/GAS1 domain-containing protein n=1 Tax=Anopheles culicifacies TaxID=139723 RepID=A0A182M0Z4_9DIPT